MRSAVVLRNASSFDVFCHAMMPRNEAPVSLMHIFKSKWGLVTGLSLRVPSKSARGNVGAQRRADCFNPAVYPRFALAFSGTQPSSSTAEPAARLWMHRFLPRSPLRRGTRETVPRLPACRRVNHGSGNAGTCQHPTLFRVLRQAEELKRSSFFRKRWQQKEPFSQSFLTQKRLSEKR